MRFSKFRVCLTCICLCLTLLFPRAAWVVITFCCGHARKPRCQFLNWRRFCCDSVVRFCFWHRAPPHQCYVHRGRRVSQGCQGGHQSSCKSSSPPSSSSSSPSSQWPMTIYVYNQGSHQLSCNAHYFCHFAFIFTIVFSWWWRRREWWRPLAIWSAFSPVVHKLATRLSPPWSQPHRKHWHMSIIILI